VPGRGASNTRHPCAGSTTTRALHRALAQPLHWPARARGGTLRLRCAGPAFTQAYAPRPQQQGAKYWAPLRGAGAPCTGLAGRGAPCAPRCAASCTDRGHSRTARGGAGYGGARAASGLQGPSRRPRAPLLSDPAVSRTMCPPSFPVNSAFRFVRRLSLRSCASNARRHCASCLPREFLARGLGDAAGRHASAGAPRPQTPAMALSLVGHRACALRYFFTACGERRAHASRRQQCPARPHASLYSARAMRGQRRSSRAVLTGWARRSALLLAVVRYRRAAGLGRQGGPHATGGAGSAVAGRSGGLSGVAAAYV